MYVWKERLSREIIQVEVKEKVTIRNVCAYSFFLRLPAESMCFPSDGKVEQPSEKNPS